MNEKSESQNRPNRKTITNQSNESRGNNMKPNNQERPLRPLINSTDNKELQPQEPEKRIISYQRTLNKLPENATYKGVITECDIKQGKKNEFLTLKIQLDSNVIFSTICAYPLNSYSPLINLISELEENDNRNIYIEDLIELAVSFTTRIVEKNGAEYCNIKTIEWLADDSYQEDSEDEIDSYEEQDDNSDDNEDDVDSFFQE